MEDEGDNPSRMWVRSSLSILVYIWFLASARAQQVSKQNE
jgi:hypothetical protein